MPPPDPATSALGRIGAADLPPLLLAPRYLAKPWGGRRLAAELGRRGLPPGPVGESWEAGTLAGGWGSRVEGGPLDGCPLQEALGRPFPLLLKVLDAHEDLSVQVHPDGARAKEEAWVALADGGSVATGRVPPGPVPAPGRWLEHLERTPLRGPAADHPPSIVHVPAGTVHAILAGSLVFEVQTPVDVTWRLDDHGRLGLDGRPRALHLAEAAAVLARGPEPACPLEDGGATLRARRFTLAWRPAGTWRDLPGAAAFLAGGGEVRHRGGAVRVPPGRTVVLTPAVTEVRAAGPVIAVGATGRADGA